MSKSRKVVPWPPDRNRPNERDSVVDASWFEGNERTFLAFLMTNRNGVERFLGRVTPEVFSVPRHRLIYGAILDLHDERENINIVTISERLRDKGKLVECGDRAGITDFAGVTTSAEIAESALDYMLDAYRERAALRIFQDGVAGKITPDQAQAQLATLHQRREAEQSWDDALDESVVTSSALHNLELTPRRKLLGDWMAEGDLGFIFAPRGVGKTWMALAMAQALSTGGKLGEWPAHDPVKVLYVDGEMPPDLMRDRTNGLQASNDNLEFLNHEILFDRTGKTLNIANREVQQAITDHCIKTCVKVLILDNLSTLASGMKENEADAWELVNNWLLDLRRRKVAVVIIHHAGRSGEMRGTSKREDNVFWIIALDDRKKDADDKRGARFISHFTKPSRNTQHEPPAYEWHFVTEVNGDVSISHKQAQTLEVFRSVIESGVTKTDEIAEAMKVPKYVISRMAKKAMDEGWLDKPKRGEYALKGGQK